MSESIVTLVDDLPTSGMTVYTLRALDFAIPGEWENLVGFENTVRTVTGETDAEFIQLVTERVKVLYNDPNQGYQRAMWMYRTVDSTDAALAAAAMANKVGSKIPLFGSFFSRVTPKAETAQTIDLSLKVIVELVAFCYINGIPGDSVTDFLRALNEYGKESLMRMAALICIDGLLPLGPNFTGYTLTQIKELTPSRLEDNRTFSKLKSDIPGEDTAGKLAFITDSFGSIKSWLDEFTVQQNLTPQKVVSNLQTYVDIADDKLDYLGAFLDMSTSYYTHTGTQTLARRLIERAVNEV